MLIGLRSLFSPRRAGWLLAAVLFTGCENRETRVYRVPKPLAASHVAPPAAHAAHQSAAHPRRAHVHWQLPKGWEELPPSEMRMGDFRVHGADGRAEVTIIPLAGLAGSDVDNVNRWRGQVGLEPITEGQLKENYETVEIADQSSRLYDMAGVSGDDEKTRILVTILRRGETSWFFKMIGGDALVQREKATFKSFLKAISFDGEAKSPDVVESPKSAPPAPKPSWKVPADWRELPPGQMQTAKFALADNAEVTVAAFPGDVGGLLANVNRWRDQLGHPPVDAAELPRVTTRLDAGGTAATLVDITAENKQRRMIAVVLPRGEETWFFKLLGDEPAVAGAKNLFVNFVKSAE
jgi:hypothetical protein